MNGAPCRWHKSGERRGGQQQRSATCGHSVQSERGTKRFHLRYKITKEEDGPPLTRGVP
jgi:hypothetical protein